MKKASKLSIFHWEHPALIIPEQFNKVVSFVKTLIEITDVPLSGGLGEESTKPVVDSETICFNGVAPDDAETFYFPRISNDIRFIPTDGLGQYYRICDTRACPYDNIVVATLKAAEYYGIVNDWYTDDYPEDHEEGVQLFEVVKNYMIIKEKEKNEVT